MDEHMENQDALEKTEQDPASEEQKNQDTQETTEQEKPKKKSGRHLTPEERLARIAEQQKQLSALARQIRAQEDAKARKARAHRLIQVGAIVEGIYGAPIEGDPMLEALKNFLIKQNERGNYFTDALKKGEEAKRKAEEEAAKNDENV